MSGHGKTKQRTWKNGSHRYAESEATSWGSQGQASVALHSSLPLALQQQQGHQAHSFYQQASYSCHQPDDQWDPSWESNVSWEQSVIWPALSQGPMNHSTSAWVQSLQGCHPGFGSGHAQDGSSERPKLQLKPRTLPLESDDMRTAKNGGPIGSLPAAQNRRWERNRGVAATSTLGGNASNIDPSYSHGSDIVGGVENSTATSSSSTSGQKRVCYKWKTNSCERGDRCKWAHPPEYQGVDVAARQSCGAWRDSDQYINRHDPVLQQNGSMAFTGGGAVGSTASPWGSRIDSDRDGNAKGGKGKRKGKSWGDNLPRHVKISKTLTQILRHKAPELGIAIDAAGFCTTKDILEAKWLRELECTMEDIEKVVKESDKQRFEVDKNKEGDSVIRAVQGHSIEGVDDELALERLTQEAADLPEICVHGTYYRYVDSILKSGLKPGGTEGSAFRKHVHFAPFEPGDKRVVSGMRYDAEVGIWIDLRRAIQAGIPFYISPNKVILSPGKNQLVPVEFFDKVVDLKSKRHIWPP